MPFCQPVHGNAPGAEIPWVKVSIERPGTRDLEIEEERNRYYSVKSRCIPTYVGRMWHELEIGNCLYPFIPPILTPRIKYFWPMTKAITTGITCMIDAAIRRVISAPYWLWKDRIRIGSVMSSSR